VLLLYINFLVTLVAVYRNGGLLKRRVCQHPSAKPHYLAENCGFT